MGAKVQKGEKRQVGIFSEIAKWASNASTCLFVEDRAMSFNSAGIQVHQQEKKGWLIISSLYLKCVFQRDFKYAPHGRDGTGSQTQLGPYLLPHEQG